MKGKNKFGEIIDIPADEEAAEIAAFQASIDAGNAARALLDDIPANENSIVALKAKVNLILSLLRGD